MLCAVFRRGERGFASWDGLTGTVLTQGLQCSAQGFAGASGCVVSGDLLAGMWRAEVWRAGTVFF